MRPMRSSSPIARMIACVLVAGALWLLGAQRAQAQSRDLEVRWAPWLHLDSVAAAKAALRKRQAQPLRMKYYGAFARLRAAPLTVRTCAEYLVAADTGYAPAGPGQFRVAGEEYSPCPVVKFIAASFPAVAGPPLVAVGGGFGWSLPPLDCPGECGGHRRRSYELARSSGRPWAWWDPGLQVTRRSGLVVYLRDQGWGYAVSLVAERIPPPPLPRLYAVVVSTVARHGSYHAGTFAVLVRRGVALQVVRTGPSI
ncbi:MAG: hypothetical protein ACRD2F_02905 [Terriglobales bacterium]